MRSRRFFAPKFSEHRKTTLGPQESHHLVNVLRLSVGSEVEVFDGSGNAARARVSEVSPGAATLEIQRPLPSQESPLELWVAVCPPKGERMATLVRQLTELGIRALIPMVSDHSTAHDKTTQSRRARWSKIALEACKQSGRSRVPEIADARDTLSLLESWGSVVLVADRGESARSLPDISESATRPLLLAIGPEGGFSEPERRRMAEGNAVIFGLGPRVLRIETAAVAAVSLIQARYGDLGDALVSETSQPHASGSA